MYLHGGAAPVFGTSCFYLALGFAGLDEDPYDADPDLEFHCAVYRECFGSD
jgi:hypothetical protein